VRFTVIRSRKTVIVPTPIWICIRVADGLWEEHEDVIGFSNFQKSGFFYKSAIHCLSLECATVEVNMKETGIPSPTGCRHIKESNIVHPNVLRRQFPKEFRLVEKSEWLEVGHDGGRRRHNAGPNQEL